MTEITPHADGPAFTDLEIWQMREMLREVCGWSAKDVQDLPPLDLWDLYREARLLEQGR